MRVSGSDLRLFKVFDAVVRNQGFGAAECELNINASTISNHMTALEQRLGVRLCRRGRAGFVLTEQGAKAYEAVQRLLDATVSFDAEIEGVQSNRPSEFRIGLVDSVASDPNCHIAEAITAFKKELPEVRLVLMQEPPNELQAKVRDGEYHCGIGSFPHQISSLDRVPLYREQHFLYVGKGHPLFDSDESILTAEHVRRFETVRRGYWRDRDERQFELGATRALVNQIEPQLILILGGSFIGLLPTHVAQPWLSAGQLRPILPERFSYRCDFEFIRRRGGEPADLVDSFLACCERVHCASTRRSKPQGRAESRPQTPRLPKAAAGSAARGGRSRSGGT